MVAILEHRKDGPYFVSITTNFCLYDNNARGRRVVKEKAKKDETTRACTREREKESDRDKTIVSTLSSNREKRED